MEQAAQALESAKALEEKARDEKAHASDSSKEMIAGEAAPPSRTSSPQRRPEQASAASSARPRKHRSRHRPAPSDSPDNDPHDKHIATGDADQPPTLEAHVLRDYDDQAEVEEIERLIQMGVLVEPVPGEGGPKHHLCHDLEGRQRHVVEKGKAGGEAIQMGHRHGG